MRFDVSPTRKRGWLLPRLTTLCLVLAQTATIYSTDVEAKTHRSSHAVSEFKKAHPCPANGNRSGPCPGWTIDHIKPLDCGGADDSSNMQWQTDAAAIAKNKWERKGCGSNARAENPITSSQPQRGYIRGPKGGCFTYTPSGQKRYVAHSYCGE